MTTTFLQDNVATRLMWWNPWSFYC